MSEVRVGPIRSPVDMATTERLSEVIEEYERVKDEAERKLETYRRILDESEERTKEARETLRRAHYLP